MNKKIKIIVIIFVLSVITLGTFLDLYPKPSSKLIKINNTIAYIAVPENYNKHTKLPVIMAIHGSGRRAENYDDKSEYAVDFYVHQKALAISQGYIFAVISNGDDTWGTDKGLKNLDTLYTYIQNNYNVKDKWVLWATSAGGLQMNRFIKTYPERAVKAIGTFPVYDLADMVTRNDNAHKIWNGKDISRINPANFPEYLINVPYLIYHGKDDKVVPSEKHSIRFSEDVNALGGNVTLHIVDGGHSTDNFNVYDDKEICNFLKFN